LSREHNTLSSGTSDNSPEVASTSVGIYAPLLVHPAEHFFFGLGPQASTDISRTYTYGTGSYDNRRTALGIGLTVGGWI
jgi:hypothetical protein